jgi:hypothetical protein
MIAVSMVGNTPQRRVVTRQADGTMPVVGVKLSPVAAQPGPV